MPDTGDLCNFPVSVEPLNTFPRNRGKVVSLSLLAATLDRVSKGSEDFCGTEVPPTRLGNGRRSLRAGLTGAIGRPAHERGGRTSIKVALFDTLFPSRPHAWGSGESPAVVNFW